QALPHCQRPDPSVEGWRPGSRDGTVLCPAQLPGAPDPVATDDLTGINSFVDGRVVNGRLALGVVWHGQALPLHPRIKHPQNDVEDAVIAQFALRSPLGHREMREDKCLELWFGELDRNWRRFRLW